MTPGIRKQYKSIYNVSKCIKVPFVIIWVFIHKRFIKENCKIYLGIKRYLLYFCRYLKETFKIITRDKDFSNFVLSCDYGVNDWSRI